MRFECWYTLGELCNHLVVYRIYLLYERSHRPIIWYVQILALTSFLKNLGSRKFKLKYKFSPAANKNSGFSKLVHGGPTAFTKNILISYYWKKKKFVNNQTPLFFQ